MSCSGAIHVIANGEALLSPTVTRKLIEEFVRRPPDLERPPPRELEQLTPREAEILRLVARDCPTPRSRREHS